MLEIWRAEAGGEERVKAAEDLFDDRVDLEATKRFLANDANELLIAYVDGDAAGFVSATELTHPDQARPELFLNEVGVADAYRGRGVGRALVERLWAVARDRGCRGMWVLTEEDNVAANKGLRGGGGNPHPRRSHVPVG